MIQILKYIRGYFQVLEERTDPVSTFFIHGTIKEKRRLYERALKAADSDQKKVIAEYRKKLEYQV